MWQGDGAKWAVPSFPMVGFEVSSEVVLHCYTVKDVTMSIVGGRIRIITSLVFGLLIVAGAVFMRHPVAADTDVEDPRLFVAQVPLREYQEPVDSDGDGLRDWLEELTGTDPNVNDAARIASSTASTSVATDTETAKFAISFFEEFITQHKGKKLTDAEKQAIVAKSTKEFRALNTDTLYTRANITIEDGSVRDYGNAVGTAILSHNEKSKDVEHELVILGHALERDDRSLMAPMSVIRENYEGMTEAVKNVPVPPEAIDAHLALLNSLQAITTDIVAFEKVFDDPLIAFLRIKRYQDDVNGLATSIEMIRGLLEQNNIVYTNLDAGQLFFTFRP